MIRVNPPADLRISELPAFLGSTILRTLLGPKKQPRLRWVGSQKRISSETVRNLHRVRVMRIIEARLVKMRVPESLRTSCIEQARYGLSVNRPPMLVLKDVVARAEGQMQLRARMGLCVYGGSDAA